jgi:hypothetical protein
MQGPEVIRGLEGIGGGADEHARRHGDLAPGQELPLVAHGADGL